MSQPRRNRPSVATVFLLIYGLWLTLFLLLPAEGAGGFNGFIRLLEPGLGQGFWHSLLAWCIQFALLVPIGFAVPIATGRTRPRARITLVAAAAVFSAAIEIAQQFIPGRESSVAEAVARPLGALVGVLLLALYDQWRLPAKERAGAQVSRRVLAEWDYFRYVYRDETSMLWGLAGVALTFLILPEPWSHFALIATLVVTVWLLLAEILGVYKKWAGAKFEKRPAPSEQAGSHFSAVPDRSGRNRGIAARAAAWHAREPQLSRVSLCDETTHTEVWFDNLVDQELRRQSAQSMGDAPARSGDPEPAAAYLARHSYQLPSPLADVSAAALRLDRSSAHPIDPKKTRLPIRFNGRLLRLATEPSERMLTSGKLQFEPVRYFDGEASNEMWRYLQKPAAGEAATAPLRSPVEPFVLDRDGRMQRLENAEAGNLVGISIMALTQDNQLIFVRQALGNSIAPKALAASGSGSLELIDFHAALNEAPAAVLPESSASSRRARRAANVSDRLEVPAVRLLLHGMLREMSEESGIRASEIIASSAMVTGYFRWVERAMKPEFVGIVRLSVTAAEASQRLPARGERPFTTSTIQVPLPQELLSEFRADAANYTGNSKALGEALEAFFEGQAEAGTTPSAAELEQLVRMSPSCEHASIIALRFLASDEGSEWMARSSNAAAAANGV